MMGVEFEEPWLELFLGAEIHDLALDRSVLVVIQQVNDGTSWARNWVVVKGDIVVGHWGVDGVRSMTEWANGGRLYGKRMRISVIVQKRGIIVYSHGG